MLPRGRHTYTQIFETLAELVLERTGCRKSGCMGEKWPGVWKEFWEVDRGWNDSGVLGRLRRVERGFERVFWIVTRLGSLREGFRRGGGSGMLRTDYYWILEQELFLRSEIPPRDNFNYFMHSFLFYLILIHKLFIYFFWYIITWIVSMKSFLNFCTLRKIKYLR